MCTFMWALGQSNIIAISYASFSFRVPECIKLWYNIIAMSTSGRTAPFSMANFQSEVTKHTFWSALKVLTWKSLCYSFVSVRWTVTACSPCCPLSTVQVFNAILSAFCLYRLFSAESIFSQLTCVQVCAGVSLMVKKSSLRDLYKILRNIKSYIFESYLAMKITVTCD